MLPVGAGYLALLRRHPSSSATAAPWVEITGNRLLGGFPSMWSHSTQSASAFRGGRDSAVAYHGTNLESRPSTIRRFLAQGANLRRPSSKSAGSEEGGSHWEIVRCNHRVRHLADGSAHRSAGLCGIQGVRCVSRAEVLHHAVPARRASQRHGDGEHPLARERRVVGDGGQPRRLIRHCGSLEE